LCDDGDYDYADIVACQALCLARAHTHLWAMGRANYILGRVAMARHQRDAAGELLGNALRIHRELRYNQGVVWTLLALARLRLVERRNGAACKVLLECLSLAYEAGDHLSIAQTLEMFAEFLAPDAPQAAIQAAASAATLRDALDARPPKTVRRELDIALGRARNQLGQARSNAAWDAGRQLLLDEACAFVRAAAEAERTSV
jgi:hypothetical protein